MNLVQTVIKTSNQNIGGNLNSYIGQYTKI